MEPARNVIQFILYSEASHSQWQDTAERSATRPRDLFVCVRCTIALHLCTAGVSKKHLLLIGRVQAPRSDQGDRKSEGVTSARGKVYSADRRVDCVGGQKVAADRGLRPSVYPTKTAAFGYSERSGAPATEGKDHAEGRDGDHGQHGGRREEEGGRRLRRKRRERGSRKD